MSFTELGLSKPILDAVRDQGYETPTQIQLQVIPEILKGNDILAAAQTGTGKTAGFTLPLLELLNSGKKARPKNIRALIVAPTRELALQIKESVNQYSKNLSLSSAVVFGGVKAAPHIQKLRPGIDILVATPGRLLDLYSQKAVEFSQLEILVLDEADRMLDMGFIHDIKRIIRLIPNKRQNLFFSATFSEEIRSLAKDIVNNPVEVSVNTKNSTTELVEQWIYPVDKSKKTDLLTHLIKTHNWHQVLIFSKTKSGADRLARILNKEKITTSAIHGDKSQNARTKALSDFKALKSQVLVATDIAARGLDIEQLPYVINFNLPHVSEDYVHRIGRTGRAGATGIAISLVCSEEYPELAGIEYLIKKIIDRKIIAGFEPVVELEESNLDRKPPKIVGPKSKNNSPKGKPRFTSEKRPKKVWLSPEEYKKQKFSGKKKTNSNGPDKRRSRDK